MAKIVLTRLDGRLIHGQVAGNALKRSGATKLIIIDEELPQDAFQCEILQYVCPTGVKLEIFSPEEIGEIYKNNELGEESIFLLLKDIPNAYKAYKAGFKFPSVQVGGLRDSKNERKNIAVQVYINKEEAEMLTEMNNDGIDVFVQPLPDSSPISWNNVLKKHFPDLIK